MSTGPTRRKSPEEVVEQLRELLATNAAGNAQVAAHLSDFVRDISKEIGRGERVDPAELLSRWIDFNLASYSVLSKQSLALLDGLLSVARTTLVPTVSPAASVGPDARVELRVSGRLGERVATGFVIENHFDRPLEVSFECDDLTTTGGQALSGSLVVFEPPKLPIPARNQAVGQVAVPITKEFVVGETYATTIRLLGFEPKELGLSITVLPPLETQ